MSTPPGSIKPVRIIVVGASGRMGSRLCALAHEQEQYQLAGAVDAADSPLTGSAAAPRSGRGEAAKIANSPGIFAIGSADVVIDFSSDAGARAALGLAQRIGAALLVGTTALSDETRSMLREASQKISVLISPNTSLGVTALARAVREMAIMLGDQYHCSIVEAHHSAKKDAPSGTALRLAESARNGGAHVADEQILAVRGGDVIGEHTVRFAGPGEYIELTHRATSRDLFVRGALACASWLAGKPAGWFTMEDVLQMPAR